MSAIIPVITPIVSEYSDEPEKDCGGQRNGTPFGGLRKRLFWLVLSMTCDSMRGQAYASEFASLMLPRFGPKVTQV